MTRTRRGGLLVAKVHQLSGRIFTRMLKRHGLGAINPAQGRILFVLWEEDGISIQELARRTSLGKSTLTSMLDRLEAAGNLRRVPSRADRRSIEIHLTAKDRALRDAYRAVSAEMQGVFYRGIPAKEIDAFERTLARVLGNLEGVG